MLRRFTSKIVWKIVLHKTFASKPGGERKRGGFHGVSDEARDLDDLCIYGCFRITDSGILHVAHPSLRRLNHCGCYKVGPNARRYLFSVAKGLLLYNKPREFGHGTGYMD